MPTAIGYSGSRRRRVARPARARGARAPRPARRAATAAAPPGCGPAYDAERFDDDGAHGDQRVTSTAHSGHREGDQHRPPHGAGAQVGRRRRCSSTPSNGAAEPAAPTRKKTITPHSQPEPASRTRASPADDPSGPDRDVRTDRREGGRADGRERSPPNRTAVAMKIATGASSTTTQIMMTPRTTGPRGGSGSSPDPVPVPVDPMWAARGGR